jgi:hypothetical protein
MAIGKIAYKQIPSKALEDGVRSVVTEFLAKCKHTAHIPHTANCAIFERECWVEAYRRGYDMDHVPKHLHVGILVSNAAYFYLSHELKLYIAYYTALMLAVDDNFDIMSDGIIHFMERYQRGERHPHLVLNNIADLLADTATFYDPVATNLIMCASFSFMNAMVIEHITAGMKVSRSLISAIQILISVWRDSSHRKPSGTHTTYVSSLAFPRPTPLSSFGHR